MRGGSSGGAIPMPTSAAWRGRGGGACSKTGAAVRAGARSSAGAGHVAKQVIAAGPCGVSPDGRAGLYGQDAPHTTVVAQGISVATEVVTKPATSSASIALSAMKRLGLQPFMPLTWYAQRNRTRSGLRTRPPQPAALRASADELSDHRSGAGDIGAPYVRRPFPWGEAAGMPGAQFRSDGPLRRCWSCSLETTASQDHGSDMRAAISKHMTVVLVLLGLLVGLPALASSLISVNPLPCGTMNVAATELQDTQGTPCNPAAPEPSMLGCPASAIGCVALGLPDASPSAPPAPQGAAWAAGPPGIGPGQPVEPDLFPPILPA